MEKKPREVQEEWRVHRWPAPADISVIRHRSTSDLGVFEQRARHLMLFPTRRGRRYQWGTLVHYTLYNGWLRLAQRRYLDISVQ